jgi:hypothetical protein
MKRSNLWKIWALSLGEKASECDKEADKVAIIRTLMFLSIFITNIFIIFNAVRTHIIPAETKDIKCSIEYPRYMNKPFEYE